MRQKNDRVEAAKRSCDGEQYQAGGHNNVKDGRTKTRKAAIWPVESGPIRDFYDGDTVSYVFGVRRCEIVAIRVTVVNGGRGSVGGSEARGSLDNLQFGRNRR